MDAVTFGGAIHEFTYHESITPEDLNELRDQKLYNAIARYNYTQFFREGRIAIFNYAEKIGYGVIKETFLLHVTVYPCVPFNGVFFDWSYLFDPMNDMIDALAERYDH